MKIAALLLAVPAVVACSKKSDAPSAPAAPPVAIDVAAVNALVPADLKDKLVFEKRDVTEEAGKNDKRTYTLAAPKTWTEGKMKMLPKLEAPQGDNWGFRTGLSFASNCDGSCEPKDWAAVSDKVDLAQFHEAQFKIDKDEKAKTNHLVVAHTDDSVYVTYVWWTEGAKNYHRCSATLEKGMGADDKSPDIRKAAAAFEQACKAVQVSS